MNKYKRYQIGLTMDDIFPIKEDGTCRCGCGHTLPKRKRKWFSKECQHNALTNFLIIKGDIPTIRCELYKIDKGVCRICKTYDENWQADHIKSVAVGGGACPIDNFQTLCLECHKKKTKILMKELKKY